MSHVSPFARKLSAFVRLSDREAAVLSDLHRRRRRFSPGHDIIRQGEKSKAAYVLATGWASSYVLLPNGLRQIVGIQIPGDFLGLNAVLLRTSDHSVEPITPIFEASAVQVSDLLEAVAEPSLLAKAALCVASHDQTVLVEHMISIGRRDSAQRTAHFLLELWVRLQRVGLGDTSGYPCPLTQYHLADALGLSPVHINRVLRILREDGLVTFQNGQVSFGDFDRLVDFADFDLARLNQKATELQKVA